MTSIFTTNKSLNDTSSGRELSRAELFARSQVLQDEIARMYAELFEAKNIHVRLRRQLDGLQHSNRRMEDEISELEATNKKRLGKLGKLGLQKRLLDGIVANVKAALASGRAFLARNLPDEAQQPVVVSIWGGGMQYVSR